MVFKKILKNLAIFLGILIGIGFITLGCMYFIPNLTIFGLKFKKAGLNDATIQNLAEYESQCDCITLNIGHVNLDIVSANDDYRSTFAFAFRDDARGIVKKDKSTLSYTVTLEGTNLVIDFNEPEGWVFWKDTWATLTLSQDWLTSLNKKIIINSSDGKVSVATSAEKSNGIRFAFTTTFDYVEFNSTGKGTFEISDNVVDLKVHSNKGKTTVSGLCDKLAYTTNKGELDFAAIGEINATAKNAYIHGKVVGGSFIYSGGDGKIDIERIGAEDAEAQTSINGENVTTIISNVFGKIKLNVTKGDVKIENYKTSDYYLNEIKTEKSKIEVYNIDAAKLSLVSNKGQIISSASGNGNISITNNSGKTTFTGQDSNGAKFSGSIYLISGNGEINLNKISSSVSAETTGKGKINAEFTNVNAENSLKTNKGKITVKVNIAESFVINAQSAKKNVVVALNSIAVNYKDKSHEVKTINVGGSDGTNKINIYAANAEINISQI